VEFQQAESTTTHSQDLVQLHSVLMHVSKQTKKLI